MSRIAIVLFNLGGPHAPQAVKPFLFNLFNDKAIISLPQPMRYLLAKMISTRRAPFARAIYEKLGGSSPLLSLTQEQAQALEAALQDKYKEVRVFPCMRYWHPMTLETVAKVKTYNPDKLLLLPLYPQFSTTTTGSSLSAWHKEMRYQKVTALTSTLCCYPTHPGFLSAHATLIKETLTALPKQPSFRLLFSAHGLPEKIIAKGDPYAWQIEQTAKGIVEQLAIPALDWRISYQSRVGPLKWIGPSTEEEIHRAGKEGKALVVVPIAFVSEHSETLVELDMEYAELAEEAGVPRYTRVPALGTHPQFIDALAEMAQAALSTPAPASVSHTGARLCPPEFTQCKCVPYTEALA